MNNENSKKDDIRFDFIDDGLTKNERIDEINRLIEARNQILISMGYYISNNKEIVPPIGIDKEIMEYAKNKIELMVSGIIGFAIGDALGVPVEFFNREKLTKNPINDMIGFGTHSVSEGTWSDDTSMMLATMDSILETKSIDYFDIMTKFLEWIEQSKYTATNYVFDIGELTKKAILKFKNGVNIYECGNRGINSNGNGSLMRMLPIAYYLFSNNFTEEDEIKIINNVSSLTHGHEISCLGCKIFIDYIKQLLNGVDKNKALNYIRKTDYSKFYSNNSIKMYKHILSDDISKLSKKEIKSSGFIVDTLEACLWSTLTSNSYEETVLKAINLGGDTDTIGALSGALSGIIYGEINIPRKWKYRIKNRKYLENLTDKFVLYLNEAIKTKIR